MSEYKISLGVDVDVSDIQSQINTKAKDVSIPIKLEVENIGDIKKQIQGLGVLKGGIEIPLSIDSNATIKSAQQIGQKIGTTITKDVKKAIDIDDVIDQEVLNLMKTFSIVGDKGSNAFKEIRQALVECRSELQKLKNSDFGIDAELFGTSQAFDKVTVAVANQMRAVNSLGDEYVELAKYMKSFNDPKKGNKVRVPDFIKQEQGDDYKSSRGTLGIAFNTEKGISFASFLEDLNHELGISIDLTKGEEKAYEELVHKIRLGREQLEAQKKSQTSLQANASTEEILSQNFINRNEIRDVAESSIDYINATEAASSALVQSSTQAANTVVQNEERIQQAKRETAEVASDANRNLTDGLSNTGSVDGLIATFGRLSDVLEGLSNSFLSVQKYFDGLGASSNSLNNLVDSTSQGLNNNANILEKFKSSLRNIGMGTDEIDAVANRIQNLGIQIETLDQKRIRAAAGKGKKKGKNILSVDISGTDKDGNVVKFTEQYNVANGRLIKSIEDVSTAQKKAGTQTNTFVKQQKNAVADLTNTINQLNRAAIDPNAGKPIKDDAHLKRLSSQYKSITDAIEKMGRASNDNDFQEERNNVKGLISEYKILTREYRNAETSATSFRSKDIDTIKSTNASDLDVLIQKMKDAGVYTAGFEKGAENLRKVLNNATDTSGINEFLNGFDKLEAGYKRAAQYAKSSEKATTYSKRAQGLAESIKSIQRISPEINDFEVDVNGAKVSVQSLLDALSKVKTKGDFDNINEDLKVFKKSAEAAGIATRETAKEANSNFNKLKSLAKEMGKVDIELTKVDNVDDFNSLKRLANDLEAEYKDLYDTIGRNLNPDQLRELDQIFANTTGAVRELNNEMARSAETSELTSGLERLKTIAKEINGLKLDIFKFEDADNIERASNQLNELENEAAELRATLQQKFNITSFDEIDNIARQGEEALNSLIAKAAEVKAKLANGIKIDVETGKYDNQMSQMYERFDKLSNASDELRNSIAQVENAYRELDSATNLHKEGLIDDEKLVQIQRKYAAALENTNNLLRIQAREEAAVARAKNLAQKKESIQLDTINWLKENTKAVKKYGDELEKLLVLLARAKDEAAANEIVSKIDLVKKRAKSTGDTGLTLWDKLISKAKEYSVYVSAADVLMWVEQGAREMFNTVKEIDTAMTGLYRVTDLTSSQYDTLFGNMIDSAKEYGATLNDIINATSDWVRAGFDADTALGLAEVTTMYQHISDLDYDTAAENLITAYNGFKNELDTAFSGDTVAAVNYIADIFNELDRQNCPLVV